MLALNPRLKGEAAGVFVVFFFFSQTFFCGIFFLVYFLNLRLKGETAEVFVVFSFSQIFFFLINFLNPRFEG